MLLRPSIDRWPLPFPGDAALAARIAALCLALTTLWMLSGWMLAPASRAEGWALALAGAGGLFLLLRWFARAIRRRELPLLEVAEHASDAITIADARMRIIYANPAACAMTGYPRDDLIGKPIASLLPPRDHPALESLIARLGHQSSCRDVWTILRQDGGEALAEVSARRLPAGHFLAVARDVSDRERALAALRKSEEFNRAVLDSAASQIAVLDRNGTIIAINEAWRQFGERHPRNGDFPARAGIGADFLDSYRNTAADAGEGVGDALAGIEAVLAGRSDSFSVDCTCLASGALPCFMMRVTPLRTGDSGAVVAYQDITPIHLAQEAREQANRQLEALALRHVAIQEEERRALSRELHDHIGQTLTALKIGLEASRRRCGELCQDHRSESAIARSCDIADDLIDTIRHLSLRLRPALLDDLGLAAAVRWHLETSPLPNSIAVDLYENLDGDRFPTETELACFRVIQESVSNALRHSGASEISISLIRCPGELHLAVRDNGCGFDVGNFEHRRDLNSLGLLGMRERVAGLDGRFYVDSRPGSGTEVIASFPLPVAS